jgi:hypothetical protein
MLPKQCSLVACNGDCFPSSLPRTNCLPVDSPINFNSSIKGYLWWGIAIYTAMQPKRRQVSVCTEIRMALPPLVPSQVPGSHRAWENSISPQSTVPLALAMHCSMGFPCCFSCPYVQPLSSWRLAPLGLNRSCTRINYTIVTSEKCTGFIVQVKAAMRKWTLAGGGGSGAKDMSPLWWQKTEYHNGSPEEGALLWQEPNFALGPSELGGSAGQLCAWWLGAGQTHRHPNSGNGGLQVQLAYPSCASVPA